MVDTRANHVKVQFSIWQKWSMTWQTRIAWVWEWLFSICVSLARNPYTWKQITLLDLRFSHGYIYIYNRNSQWLHLNNTHRFVGRNATGNSNSAYKLTWITSPVVFTCNNRRLIKRSIYSQNTRCGSNHIKKNSTIWVLNGLQFTSAWGRCLAPMIYCLNTCKIRINNICVMRKIITDGFLEKTVFAEEMHSLEISDPTNSFADA